MIYNFSQIQIINDDSREDKLEKIKNKFTLEFNLWIGMINIAFELNRENLVVYQTHSEIFN